MRKYFVSFVIESEEGKKDFCGNDIVKFEEIECIQQVRKLEEYLLDQWEENDEQGITLLNYREI